MPPLNYRDVGATLRRWLPAPPLPAGRLLRGGRLDVLTRAAELGHPGSILNLRRGPDSRELPGVRYLHVPAADELENYDTSQRKVRAWLREVLGVLADPDTPWPVYVHCTSGRDRTGIVVAALLHLLEVPRSVVIEEYLLSEGASRAPIERALAGLSAAPGGWGVNPDRLKHALLGPRPHDR